MTSSERYVEVAYSGIWDNLIRPVPDRKRLHWADYKKQQTYEDYLAFRRRGYKPLTLQSMRRSAKVPPDVIQQAVLDYEEVTVRYDTQFTVRLSDDVCAIITAEPDEDTWYDDDKPTLDEWCRKSHNKEDTCIFFTERQLEEMHIHPNRGGYFLHVAWGNLRDVRAYHSKRGMNKHDADQMARNWVRSQLEQARTPDAIPEYVITVKVYVCGKHEGIDTLGGVEVEDQADIIDAVLENMMVESALLDARVAITAQLVHGPRQLEALAPFVKS